MVEEGVQKPGGGDSGPLCLDLAFHTVLPGLGSPQCLGERDGGSIQPHLQCPLLGHLPSTPPDLST